MIFLSEYHPFHVYEKNGFAEISKNLTRYNSKNDFVGLSKYNN